MMKHLIALLIILMSVPYACTSQDTRSAQPTTAAVKTITSTQDTMNMIEKTDAEWRAELSPEEYRVLRQKGTERAYTGKFWDHHEDGTYTCRGCQAPLFTSEQKFDSGCGWPSYYDAIDSGAIVTRPDNSYGMTRTEIVCARCGGHLGHLFDDGPNPTGLRYCVNSASIDFKKDDSEGDGVTAEEK